MLLLSMNKLTELNYVVIVVVLFLFIALISNGAQGATMTDLILSLEQVESNGNEIAYNIMANI